MADSPEAASAPTSDPSAETQNTGSQGPGPIPYERFQEMVHARQASDRRVAELQSQVQRFEQSMRQYQQAQQQSQQPPLNDTDREALGHLKRLFQADPDFRLMWQ